MTTTATRTRADAPPTRTVELVLAHIHLRLGSLALARVELETLAGLGALDAIGQIDLAEVRWRTGDLLGAGEVAGAALQDAEDDPVALVILSEVAASLGRPTEARRLASLAMTRAPDTIDAIFAGMPRSSVWPPDRAEPAPTAPTLFDRGPESERQPDTNESADDEPGPGQPSGQADMTPMTPGFWDADAVTDAAAATLPDPAREFDAGRTALVSGSFEEAGLHFGLALRLAPALALAVLEATEGARAPSVSIVRGDAYRLVGHEPEARRAYAVAASGGLPERRSRTRARPKAKPSVIPDVEPLDGNMVAGADGGVGDADPQGRANVEVPSDRAPEAGEPTPEAAVDRTADPGDDVAPPA